MDMRFGTGKVMSLFGAGSFAAAARKLGRNKLYLVCVREVRWDIGSTVSAGDYKFFY
jgi:hypothetical protein